jgi:RHS Repeat
VVGKRSRELAIFPRLLIDTYRDGYVSAFVGPAGEQTDLQYDDGGLLTHIVDPSGAVHTCSAAQARRRGTVRAIGEG